MNAQRADTTLDALLEFVKETRGFDFTGYKRSSIERRVAKRMAAVGAERYDDYVDYLELHGEEFAELFNTLLINVDRLLPRSPDVGVPRRRDRAAAARLARAGLAAPGLVRGLRVRRGAYTVAMVFARVLGDRGLPGAGQDLRHRHRRGRARPGTARRLPARARSRTCRRTRSSASSSAPISATCFARTCVGA